MGESHDPTLLSLAGAMLVLAVGVAVFSADRGAAAARVPPRLAWALLAAGAIGGGTFSAQFIALLAWDPGVLTGFELPIVRSAAILNVVGAVLGALLWAAGPRQVGLRALGGGLIGLSTSAVTYLGLSAVRLPGTLEWWWPPVLASVLLATTCFAGAFAGLRPGASRGHRYRAMATLVLGTAGLHALSMAAVATLPDANMPIPPEMPPVGELAAWVAGATLIWLGSGVTLAVVRRWLRRRNATIEAQRMRSLADATFEALAVCDDALRVLDANTRLTDLMGSAREGLLGRPITALLHPTDVAESEAAGGLAALADTGGSRQAHLVNGLPVELLARRIDTAEGARTVFALRDLSERRAAERRIRHLAQHDPLTELPNGAHLREYLADALPAASRSGAPLAVLCLDLDRFKAVNDLHGHHGGDRLLREAAERLRGAVREGDLVARLNGDEFAVVQAGAPQPDGAAALADRLIAAFAQPFRVGDDGSESCISVSIGIALFPTDAEDPSLLLSRADTALTRAKRAGRSCHAFFRPGMDASLRERRALEQDVRFAAERGECSLAYQPIAAARDKGIIGFEALLRWRHPERGNVTPDVFIPLAESTGAIHRLGEWVLTEACTEAASWPRPLSVAINASPLQVQSPGFAGLVAAVLKRTGLAPARLEIEVTESLFVSDVDRALDTLRALKAMGVRVALDDFGTGYSSLNTLRTFPFDKLKVDRAFVRGLTTDASARAIVRAVLGLSRGMGLPVTAEGVEDAEQLAELRSERCDQVQGWLIGKPLPIDAYAEVVGRLGVAAEAIAA